MFKLRNNSVDPKSYENTISEINHQPAIWAKAFENYSNKKDCVETFLDYALKKANGKLRVIFTGAGTSEYVGNTVYQYLRKNTAFDFESIATTDIVSSPRLYLHKDTPTLLVSFARSGNSPESLEAVKLADKLVNNIFHLAITCAPEGKLAKGLENSDNAFVLLMPEGSNDKGFAMTSSFTSMMLSALLVFDTHSIEEKRRRVEYICKAVENILKDEDRINELCDFDFSRIIYLGSGSHYALTNECRLKILELTAGDVSAMFESSLGFRHGPKSWVNEDTFVVSLVSNDSHTRKYDLDILNEVASDKIAKKILALSPTKLGGDYEEYVIDTPVDIEDAYLGLCYVTIAQLFSVIASVHVGNLADTPSKTGTVNRVVQGVIIHELN